MQIKLVVVVAWIAVSAGFLPSTAWNVANLSPLMVLCTFIETTAKPITTFTEQLRLEDTARESPREPCEWESMSATAWGRNLALMLIPGGTL